MHSKINRFLSAFAIVLSACSSASPSDQSPTSSPAVAADKSSAPDAMISPLVSPVTDGTGGSQTESMDSVQARTPKEAPAPADGKAAVSGTAYSIGLVGPVRGTQFYFTKAVGTNNSQLSPILVGPKPEEGDIIVNTDGNGDFSIDSLPPGNYYLIMNGVYDWVPAEQPGAGRPYLFELSANERLAVGVLLVQWP
jgi:hypothetical protein